jgi:SOS-response transcriptional repressor LexA
MVGIFAIIAIYSQGKFAIFAICLFAKIANTSDMSNLDLQDKKWLAGHLAKLVHGEKGEIAEKAGIDGTRLSRMANIDPDSTPKNIIKKIPTEVLTKFAEIFNDMPPSLRGVASREQQPPALPRPREIARKVQILDHVPAGKLRQAMSQVANDDGDHVVLGGLGNGEFIALTVDGDSMDKMVPHGAKIVVDTADRELVSGKPYVFVGRDGYSLKLWKHNPPRWAPYSTNPDHEPTYLKSKEIAQKMVVGRAKKAVLDL